MSSSAVGIIIVAILALTAVFFSIMESNRRERARFRLLVKEGWGKPTKIEYTAEEFGSIRHYSEAKDSLFTVDEITWHDLDLNRIFRKINHCLSSCGDDVLWDMIRHPSFSGSELAERERLISWFAGHEDERWRTQMILSDVGRMKGMSVYDYVERLRDAKKIGTFKFVLLAILTLADIVWLFFFPLGAVLVLLPLLLVNIAVSLRMRDSTMVYIRSFQCILRLLSTADAFAKQNISSISGYTEEMKKDAASMASFRHGAFLVTSSAQVANGLIDVILDYLKLLFHIDLIKFDQMLDAWMGHEKECIDLIEKIGTIDAAISIASFRASGVVWCVPELKEIGDRKTEAEGKTDVGGKTGAEGKTDVGGKTEADGKTDLWGKTEAEGKTDVGGMTEAEGKTDVGGKTEAVGTKSDCGIADDNGSASVKVEIHDMIHPLVRKPVPNSFCMSGGNLVTGSNASGKSTFLKNVALSAIFAQSLHTVMASSYQAPYLRVMTSMALSDNLTGGESYFIVEIKSLKRILDAAAGETPLLCIIDEVLRGTNTIERIAASSQILKNLRRPMVISFAATHDIELSYILEKYYVNWHFGEEVDDRDVHFSYQLKEGRATTRNAIRLLDVMNYDPAIVRGAAETAERFEKTGEWSL